MSIEPAILRRSPIFQLLDNEELRELGAHVDEAVFDAGEIVFQTGDPGGTMHIVLDGRVETYLIDEDHNRVPLAVVGPGEAFGEMSLLDGEARSASAQAIERTRTALIDRDDLKRLFTRKPEAAVNVLTSLSSRLRRTNLMLSQRVARNANEVIEQKTTLGDRVADQVARFGGSWYFIFSFAFVLLAWVVLNTVLLLGRPEPFDPYPFILLNLFLSMLAAIQAPVIMMSQNRQDAKDRVRAELDYQVNLKAELEVMQLHEKVDSLQAELRERLGALSPGPRHL